MLQTDNDGVRALMGGMPAEVWNRVAFHLRDSPTALQSMADTCTLFAAIAGTHQTAQEFIESAGRARTVEDFSAILTAPVMRDPNAPAPQDPNSPEAQGSTASTSQQPLPPPLPLSDQALVVESLANRLVGMKVKDLPAVRDQLQDVIDRLTRRDELTQHLTTRMLAGTIHQAAVAETPQNILDIVSSPLLRGGPGAVFSMEERSRIMETVVDSLTAMLRDGRDLVERHVREAVGQLSEATMTRLNARLDEPHQNNATLIFYGDSRDAIHD